MITEFKKKSCRYIYTLIYKTQKNNLHSSNHLNSKISYFTATSFPWFLIVILIKIKSNEYLCLNYYICMITMEIFFIHPNWRPSSVILITIIVLTEYILPCIFTFLELQWASSVWCLERVLLKMFAHYFHLLVQL